MPESNHDHAADLHIYAAHTHTAATAAHHRGDHEAAEELSSVNYRVQSAEPVFLPASGNRDQTARVRVDPQACQRRHREYPHPPPPSKKSTSRTIKIVSML